MFSRSKKDDNSPTRRPPGPPELDTAADDVESTTGGFFNLPVSPSQAATVNDGANSSLFSGMAVTTPEPVANEPAQNTSASGFSFLNASASGPEPEAEPELATGSSAFSFMASGDSQMNDTSDPNEETSGMHDTVSQSSGFGFMQTESVDPVERSVSPASSTTSFSFMQEASHGAAHVPPSGLYLESMQGLQASQDIQLGATAVAKKVKKKKAATKKVGYARDEAEAELQEDLASVPAPAPVAPVVEQPPPLPAKEKSNVASPFADVQMSTSAPAPAAGRPQAADHDTPPPLPPKKNSPTSTMFSDVQVAQAEPTVAAGNSMFADVQMAAPTPVRASQPANHATSAATPPKRLPTPEIAEHEMTRRPSNESTTSNTSTGTRSSKPDSQPRRSGFAGMISSMFGKKTDPEPEEHEHTRPAATPQRAAVPERRPSRGSHYSEGPSVNTRTHDGDRLNNTSPLPSSSVNHHEAKQDVPTQRKPKDIPLPEPEPQSQPQPQHQQASTPVRQTPVQLAPTPAPTPAPAPQPAKKLDPIQQVEEDIAAMMFDFHQNTTKLCEEVKIVHDRQQQVIQETDTLRNEQSRFQKQLHEKEAEQQRLAEAEEFEQADALNTAIESLKQQTRACADSLRALVSEAATLDRRREDGLRAQVESLATVIRELTSLKKRHENYFDALVHESTDKFAHREQLLKVEEDRIRMDRGHVERDQRNLKDESDQIEQAIAAQTTVASEAKIELETRRIILDDDIEELRRLLVAKETERAEILVQLREEDSKIQVVRDKFERQLNRLKEREDLITRSKVECDADAEVLQKKKDEHDNEQKAVEAKKAAMLSASQQLTLELNLGDRVKALLLAKDRAAATDGAQDDQGYQLRLLELKEAIADVEETTHNLQRQLRLLQEQIDVMAAELKQIVENLPQLEANKKAAASARKFKEAAAFNQEIKDITTRRDELQTQLNESSVNVETLTAKLDTARLLQDERRGWLLDAQKDADVKRFQVLLARSKELRRVRGTVDTTKGSRLQLSAAILLDSELATADAEAEEIRLKHGLTFDEGSDDDDDEEEAAEHPVSQAEEKAQETTESAPVAIDETPKVPVEINPAMIQEARHILEQLGELEIELDAAAEAEDFDKAAELDEQIAGLRERLDVLNIPQELLLEETEDTTVAKEVSPQIEDSPVLADDSEEKTQAQEVEHEQTEEERKEREEANEKESGLGDQEDEQEASDTVLVENDDAKDS